jgi:hypothetical protein
MAYLNIEPYAFSASVSLEVLLDFVHCSLRNFRLTRSYPAQQLRLRIFIEERFKRGHVL